MATNEGLVLDGLALNDVTNYRLQGLECTPPEKRSEWTEGGDADGAALVRDPLFDNREVTARIRITQRATMDAALSAIGAIVDKLEEAEKQLDGLDLVWTPANNTKSFTFKVLSGSVTELPINFEDGWFVRSPMVTVVMKCKPFAYGTEVTGSPTSSATPVVTLTVASVTGDVPAEGRLIVTDAATQGRRYMEWGLENRFYDAATSLLLDSDSMTTTGTAGTGTTRTGAYDPGAVGNSVIRATLLSTYTPTAATGNLGHVGTFRVKAHVYGAGTGPITARFAWQEGDGPYRANAPVSVHLLNNWAEIDLGIITVPAKTLGTQRWQGRVEALSGTVGDTLDVDYLVFVPAGEGYGKSRGVASVGIESFTGYDTFDTLAGAAALNLRTANAGGLWATSGVATDFVGQGFGAFGVQRTTISEASPRYAILGTTNYTNTVSEIHGYHEFGEIRENVNMYVIVRWTDANNHLAFRWESYLSSNPLFFTSLRLESVVAGVRTTLASSYAVLSVNTWWHLRLYAYASGTVIGELRSSTGYSPYGDPLKTVRASSSVVATGGTLATGKPGFADMNTSASTYTRYFNNFQAGVPVPEPFVINSGRILEVRSDGVLKADSTGTYYGSPPAYQGSRFLVPNAGDESRTSRVLVKAHRQDIESSDAANVTDNLTAQVNYTPRYLVVPR